MSNPAAVVGKWYQEVEEGFVFEVVALDDDAGTIEVQHIDGEINEFDDECWDDLTLEQVAAPEDWRNGYELSSEDSADPDAASKAKAMGDPINEIEPQITMGLLDD